MAETDVGHEPGDAGDQTVLRNDYLQVVWEHGAQLTIRDLQTEHTRVAGGPLLELVPLPGERRPRTLGLGLDHTGARAPEREQFSDVHGSGVQVQRSFPIAVQPLTVEWTMRVYDRHPFVRCMLSLQHIGTQPLVIRRMFPFVTGAWWGSGSLQLGDREHGLAIYKTGWQSWSYAGGLPMGRGDPRARSRTLSVWHNPGGRDPHQPVSGLAEVVSDGVAMFGHPESQTALLAGFLGEDRWLTQVYAQRQDGALAACVLCDDYELAPGDVIEMPPLLLALGRRDELLPAYAGALAREQGARSGGEAPTGWCSWYHYYQQVSETAVLENLASLRAVRQMLPLGTVEIDDGYQAAVGDWLDVNERFPHGMAWLAEQIREAGFRPGLWMAPFTVAANSRLAQEHPSWLVQGNDGKPAYGGRNWGVDLYGLDTSHPDARDWLQTLLQTIVEEWGYEYLKLDFLASGAVAGRRFKPLVTRGEALRGGLEMIRETVGDDVFLLGCGCPLLSAIGMVDAMRIGPDVASHWKPRYRGIPLPVSEGHPRPAMEGALRNTLERAWMAPALWINDPDCLLLRDTKSELTTAEVQAVASAIGLTGGMVFLSDRISQLTLERLDIAARLLPPMRERALPLDPFEYGVPERVEVRIERPWGSWLLLGLFNKAATERDLTVTWPELGLAPGEYHAVEFWTGTYVGLSETGAAVRVGGHGAAVLAIHAARTEPMLLSTSFHISQGGMEIAEWEHDHQRNALHWHARLGRQAAGTFTLWLPETLRPVRISSTAGKTIWAQGLHGEVIVTAEIRDEARFTLELEGTF